MTSPTIACPHCHQPIAIDEAFNTQVTQKLNREHAEELRLIQLEADKTRAELAKAADEKVTLALKTKEAELHAELKKAQTEASEKAAAEVAQELSKRSKEIEFFKEQAEKTKVELNKAQETELLLRKEKIQLEDDKKAFELEKQRQLDAERGKIQEDAQLKARQDQELKMMEMQKQLQDALKANEDMRRKLQQGSQQTQGEVLELELENLLRQEFPMDEIKPVPKGVRGADVLQVVKDKQGRVCGTIIWELKNAQWSDKWLDKLREDQRACTADIAVLVSINMPASMKDKNFYFQKGIWVSSRSVYRELAHALRLQLNQVFVTKLAAIGKTGKMEDLYQYLTGLEFKQRVEAIAEVWINLQDELEKEKRLFATKWARQEKNLRKVMDQTYGMYGDLQGIIGSSLPEIKQLQLDSGEDAAIIDQPTLL